mmetsp:Transcript_95689/g.139773  ORF Transcript_95689/g.139773 Transcript_95689/m.139773 type:complete len:80 (-) Transcript_95689:2243-2482(-)
MWRPKAWDTVSPQRWAVWKLSMWRAAACDAYSTITSNTLCLTPTQAQAQAQAQETGAQEDTLEHHGKILRSCAEMRQII